MRLSERMAHMLVEAADRENMHVVMTAGAVDELLKLVEAAEAIVELWPDPYWHVRPDPAHLSAIGFDAEYYRQLDVAISRIRGML